MAFTKSPTTSTYSNEALPAVYDIAYRSAPIDDYTGLLGQPGMTNLLAMKYQYNPGKEVIVAESRPPIAGSIITSTIGAGWLRGIYVWDIGSVYYFAVVGTGVYTSPDGKVWTQVNTLLTNVDTPVGFTEFINSSNQKSLVLVDGVEGYVFTSNAAGTKITDVDFPSPHLAFPVFLDGYLFLAKTNSADIYNSDLDNPSAWTAGNFISAEVYPDDLTALVKVDNYLMAVGGQSCEYFYDAANATGSPLARYEGATHPFGCPLPYSIASNKDTVMFFANNSDGEYVLRYIEGFKSKDINSSWVTSFLTGIADDVSLGTYLRGFFFRYKSKLFYCMNIMQHGGAMFGYHTYIYDIAEDIWSHFNNWQMWCSSVGTNTNTISFVGGNLGAAGATGTKPFLATVGVSKLYNDAGGADYDVGDWYYNRNSGSPVLDTTVHITENIRTPNVDFGTLNRKFMSRLGIDVVRLKSNPSPNTMYITLRCFDDHNNTSSIGTVDSPNFTGTFPFFTQLGSFRTRWISISNGTEFGGRVQFRGIEVEINKGKS